jgi:hypothetical protein
MVTNQKKKKKIKTCIHMPLRQVTKVCPCLMLPVSAVVPRRTCELWFMILLRQP